MAEIKLIKCTSRASVSLNSGKPGAGSNFYTFEYGEEVAVSENDDIEAVKRDTWDRCNNQVDAQIAEIVDLYRH